VEIRQIEEVAAALTDEPGGGINFVIRFTERIGVSDAQRRARDFSRRGNHQCRRCIVRR
jgi:hypothetical protein